MKADGPPEDKKPHKAKRKLSFVPPPPKPFHIKVKNLVLKRFKVLNALVNPTPLIQIAHKG